MGDIWLHVICNFKVMVHHFIKIGGCHRQRRSWAPEKLRQRLRSRLETPVQIDYLERTGEKGS